MNIVNIIIIKDWFFRILESTALFATKFDRVTIDSAPKIDISEMILDRYEFIGFVDVDINRNCTLNKKIWLLIISNYIIYIVIIESQNRWKGSLKGSLKSSNWIVR